MLSWLLGLKKSDITPISTALASQRGTMRGLIFISALVNVLALTGSIFMIQVYDRVLGSQSLPTLIALVVIAIVAYLAQGLFELMRQRLLALIGEKVEADAGPRVQQLSLLVQVRSLPPQPTAQGATDAAPTGLETNQFIRDLEAVRGFIAGPGPVAALDLPWLPLYLGILFYIEPGLGWLATAAAVFLLSLTWLSERRGQVPGQELAKAVQQRNIDGEAAARAGEAILAMGMGLKVAKRWGLAHVEALEKQRHMTFLVSRYQTAARTFRFVLQSALLALGAYYAIKGQISAGAIVACSIIATRALAPVDLVIGGLKPAIIAREGAARLTRLFKLDDGPKPQQPLPLPKSRLQVDGLVTGPPAAPGQLRATLRQVSFEVAKGSAVMVRGESGSGKSTLARALVGVWLPFQGRVRLDGSDLTQWEADHIGQSIGYLPQDVQLQPGTVFENIARFDPDAKMDDVLAASRAAGVDELVRNLGQEGYGRRIGAGGDHLSHGQRQRIGLARALYGNPFLLVLDEPNSNLDPAGDLALSGAIRGARDRGAIVIVISHRDTVVRDVDFVLELAHGQLKSYDPRDVWIAKLREAHEARKRAAQQSPPSQPPPSQPPASSIASSTPLTRQTSPAQRPATPMHAGHNGSTPSLATRHTPIDTVVLAPASQIRAGHNGAAAPPPQASPMSASPMSASPGSASPGSASPGSASPGSASPGSASPGSASPGSASPGSASPGSTSPLTSKSLTPNSLPPNSLPPSATLQGDA